MGVNTAFHSKKHQKIYKKKILQNQNVASRPGRNLSLQPTVIPKKNQVVQNQVRKQSLLQQIKQQREPTKVQMDFMNMMELFYQKMKQLEKEMDIQKEFQKEILMGSSFFQMR